MTHDEHITQITTVAQTLAEAQRLSNTAFDNWKAAQDALSHVAMQKDAALNTVETFKRELNNVIQDFVRHLSEDPGAGSDQAET